MRLDYTCKVRAYKPCGGGGNVNVGCVETAGTDLAVDQRANAK